MKLHYIGHRVRAKATTRRVERSNGRRFRALSVPSVCRLRKLRCVSICLRHCRLRKLRCVQHSWAGVCPAACLHAMAPQYRTVGETQPFAQPALVKVSVLSEFKRKPSPSTNHGGHPFSEKLVASLRKKKYSFTDRGTRRVHLEL